MSCEVDNGERPLYVFDVSPVPAQSSARYLEAVSFWLGDVPYGPGVNLRHLCFPTTSVVSLLFVTETGAPTGPAVTGREGVVGVGRFMSGGSSPRRATTEIEVRAVTIPSGLCFRVQARRRWRVSTLGASGNVAVLLSARLSRVALRCCADLRARFASRGVSGNVATQMSTCVRFDERSARERAPTLATKVESIAFYLGGMPSAARPCSVISYESSPRLTCASHCVPSVVKKNGISLCSRRTIPRSSARLAMNLKIASAAWSAIAQSSRQGCHRECYAWPAHHIMQGERTVWPMMVVLILPRADAAQVLEPRPANN